MKLDWSHIDSVRCEWPASNLNTDADLRGWQQGVRLYDNDDYRSMMQCALLLSGALAHNLYGAGILSGEDLPETVRKVLYASVEPPPDGRTFAENAQRCARLALTIVREFGWQPVSMGGDGLFERFIMDKGNYMLFSEAIAGEGQLLGDLRAFFAVPPQPAVAHIPDSRSDTSVVDDMLGMIQMADAGDQASELRTRAMALWMNGDPASALAPMEEAARLGDALAMKDAGDLAAELGKAGQSRFWFEAAANAGNERAMYNMGALAIRDGDTSTAARWYQRSAEAGNPDAYAALTQLAHERGDAAAERRWARLGAEAGQGFCIYRHGLHLAMDAKGDTALLRRAAAFLEASAERGDVDGMMMAGNVNGQLGHHDRARLWFDRARATGDPEALEKLDRYGL